MKLRNGHCLSIVAANLLIGISHASAELMASVSYHNSVLSENGPPPVGDSASDVKSLIGNTLPASQTISTATDATTTAHYEFTDNGAAASFLINAAGKLNGPGELAGETSGSFSNGFAFTLSQPAAISVSMSYSMTSGLNSNPLISMGFSPYDDASIFFRQGSGSPLTYSGILSPNVPYLFVENWSISAPYNVSSGSGSDSFSLILTAIPEPASGTLLLVAAVGLLGRRRLRQ